MKDEASEDQGTKTGSGSLAGLSKTTAFAVVSGSMGIFKGMMKWFFQSPLKFFRPYSVNPWYIFEEMAKHEGKVGGLGYIKSIYTTEGFKAVSSNFWPLLLLNSVSGLLLFNVYELTSHKLLQYFPTEKDEKSGISFISGAVSGTSVSLLVTPVHNIRSYATTADLIKNRRTGLIKYSAFLIKKMFKQKKTSIEKVKSLFRGITGNCIKDAYAYSLFFGTFDNFCRLADSFYERSLGDELDNNSVDFFFKFTRKFLPILGAGTSAGLIYNFAAYPLITFRNVTLNHLKIPEQDRMCRNISLKDVYSVIKSNGISPFYAGITPQLLRVVTPSAIGLFVYRMTTST